MVDPTSVLVDNLIEAFKQLNRLLALGLVTSVSALALERRSAASTQGDSVPVPGGFVPMAPESAQLLLVGVSFVAGLMGSYAAESAAGIVHMLQGSPDLLAAACTYSSVATAPIGIRVLAPSLPVIFVSVVFWFKWRRLKETGLITMFVLFGAAYGVLAATLAFMPCRAP